MLGEMGFDYFNLIFMYGNCFAQQHHAYAWFILHRNCNDIVHHTFNINSMVKFYIELIKIHGHEI